MSTARAQLLRFDEVVQRLNLSPEDIRWLIDTGQLPPIQIRGSVLFDEADLVRLISTYRSVQRKDHEHV